MNKYLFFAFILISQLSCSDTTQYQNLRGETMGTYYSITYKGDDPRMVQKEIDGLLVEFNNSLSTYIPSSNISNLNISEGGVTLPEDDIYFEPVLKRAKELEGLTNGDLNTRILPLIQYWNTFKADDRSEIDSTAVRELVNMIQNSRFELSKSSGELVVFKDPVNAKLDFSSLAKGYGIDIIAQYFEQEKVADYLVDIGGEARAKGKNKQGKTWSLAINKPKEGSSLKEMELVVGLDNKSIATSGNYRQYFEKNGKKFAHILDPKTGYSAYSNLLSASIIADDCMTADGLATAMMVKGLEEAKSFLELNKYPACLIYDADGDDKLEKYYTNGFEEMVIHSK